MPFALNSCCLTRPYPGWKGRLRHFYCPLWQNALHRSGKAHCSTSSFCYSYCCFHVFGKSGSCSVYTCCRTLLKQGGGYPFPCCHSGFPDNPGSLTGYAQRHGVWSWGRMFLAAGRFLAPGYLLAQGASWLRDISLTWGVSWLRDICCGVFLARDVSVFYFLFPPALFRFFSASSQSKSIISAFLNELMPLIPRLLAISFSSERGRVCSFHA